jgi:hypothetical protein
MVLQNNSISKKDRIKKSFAFSYKLKPSLSHPFNERVFISLEKKAIRSKRRRRS